MNTYVTGSYISSDDSGAEEVTVSEPVLVEVTDFSKGGEIELTFNAKNIAGEPRIYLRVNLPEAIRAAMQMCGTNDG